MNFPESAIDDVVRAYNTDFTKVKALCSNGDWSLLINTRMRNFTEEELDELIELVVNQGNNRALRYMFAEFPSETITAVIHNDKVSQLKHIIMSFDERGELCRCRLRASAIDADSPKCLKYLVERHDVSADDWIKDRKEIVDNGEHYNYKVWHPSTKCADYMIEKYAPIIKKTETQCFRRPIPAELADIWVHSAMDSMDLHFLLRCDHENLVEDLSAVVQRHITDINPILSCMIIRCLGIELS